MEILSAAAMKRTDMFQTESARKPFSGVNWMWGQNQTDERHAMKLAAWATHSSSQNSNSRHELI